MYRGVECDAEGKRPFVPQKHQIAAVDYALRSPHKGLLLYHTLGSGKSCTSILFADAILEESKTRTVRVFLPAALRRNFIDEYCKLCGKNPKLLRDRYVFYSYNYSKILDLLPLDLDNSVIIVDEAHRLINGKRNGSQIASVLYSMMYRAKNSKILLLTGTPLKRIEDIPLYVALLKPKDAEREIYLQESGFEMFREKEGPVSSITEHLEYFSGKAFKETLEPQEFTVGDRTTQLLVPRDPDTLKKQLSGIVSYYAASKDKARAEGYPETIVAPFQLVQMTTYQTNKYFSAVEWELKRFKPREDLRYKNPKRFAVLMGLWQVAKKNLMTRAASNFAYPERVQVPDVGEIGFNIPYDLAGIESKDVAAALLKAKRRGRRRKVEEPIEGVSKEEITTDVEIDYEDVPTLPDALLEDGGWVFDEAFEPKRLSGMYSPKMYRVIENIANNLNGKHAIYSVLKSRSGIRIMQSLLELCGLRTLVYSGDISSDERRSEILSAFNADDNLRGEKYKVMLITEAGGEGITLKAVKYFHVLESDKNELKIQQAIGRVVRLGSHNSLPKSERFVRVYRYFSIPKREIAEEIASGLGLPEDEEARRVEEERYGLKGIDRVLYDRGQIYYAQLDIFLKILQDVSVT